jgi:hypothetical protein
MQRMKTNKHLDEHIKEALENLEANYDPGTWDILAQRMDDAMPANDALDNLVAGSLTGLEVPAQPGSWDLMQQRIEAGEAAEMIENEAQIDGLAYDKLHRISVPYQSHHWSLMARRLEEEYALRQKLYRYKAAEMSLMVLLLLAIIRFLPYADGIFNSRPVGQQIEQFQIAPQAPGQLPGTAAPEDGLAPGTPVAANVHDGTGADNATAIELGLAERPAGIVAAAATENGANDAPAHSSLSPPQTLDSRFPNVTSLSGQTPFANAASGKDSAPGYPRPRLTKSLGLLAAIDPVTVEPLTVNALILTRANPILKKSNLRFSIFSTVDYNYVFTPEDSYEIFGTFVNIDADTTAASGYGGGILANWKRGRWEIQTGGIYSFKRYVPNTPVFLFETVNYYVNENFHGIQLDILQVPFNLHYYLKNEGNWRIYGLGGVSSHFVTSSVYEIEYNRTFAFTPPPSSPGDDSSIRNVKEFPKGLLDGGGLDDNLYFTANVGFGVERFVTPRWSVFFQPNYQHYLLKQGIGTNNDKFYTLSIYLGTKISLK